MTRRSRSRLEPAEWYSIRPVRSLKPATYRCPLCGYQLHAMSDHVLIAPEGDTTPPPPRASRMRRGGEPAGPSAAAGPPFAAAGPRLERRYTALPERP